MSGHGLDGTPALDAGAASDAAPARRPVRVLVVDDEPSIRAFVDRALQRAGVEVLVAETPRAAIRAVAGDTFRPTILLTDIEMPEMGGIELAARIRAIRPATRVVLMTGDPAQAEAARDHPGIAERCLVKPVTTAELLDALGVEGAVAREPGS